MDILQDWLDILMYDWWYTGFETILLVFVITVLGGGLVSLLGLLLLWLRVLLYAFGGGMPKCGRCGYPVRGIGSLGCPECGADLREAGIVTGRQRFRIGTLAFVMWWTALLLLPAALLSLILIVAGPRDIYTSEYLSAVLPTVIAEIQVSNDAVDEPSDTPPPIGTLSLWMTRSNTVGTAVGYVSYEIDTTNMTYQSYDATLAQPLTLDRDVFLTAWATWGVDIDDPAVIAEADELLRLLEEAPQRGLDGFSSSIIGKVEWMEWIYERPTAWFVWLQLPLWVVIWLVGLVFYVLLQRRSQHRETAKSLPPSAPVPPTTPTP